jgi:hypothetical protein
MIGFDCHSDRIAQKFSRSSNFSSCPQVSCGDPNMPQLESIVNHDKRQLRLLNKQQKPGLRTEKKKADMAFEPINSPLCKGNSILNVPKGCANPSFNFVREIILSANTRR